MADAALEPGRILAGKYRLGERLGEGGMGAVYRAEHLVLQAPVAIKVIEREVADEGTRARFMREAQAAAALRSPHVVQILDYGTEGDVPFMVMELLEGETLAQRIKRKKRLSAQETTWILTHVSRAVAKAHELGIVHRDLKPDNVFLVQNEEDEIAKVLDFGVAKIEATSLSGDSHTRTGSLLGTPYYMSPEQAQGNKTVDHRSDLWALGVITFECLTGKRPFTSEGLGDLVLQICIRDLPVPSDLAPVPIGFDAWFAKAVQREPDERFQSAKELADALREALGGKDSPSVPDILVTSAPDATPLPLPGERPDTEDARPTALEGAAAGPVDAAAATVAEEIAPFSAATLARSRASYDGRGTDDALPSGEGGQPPLSVSLHGAVSAPPARVAEGAAPPRRSNAGLFLAVGSGALAVGVLTAVLALGDRPGFRVGDIEGPSPASTPRSASARPADTATKSGTTDRQPAQPRAQQSKASSGAADEEPSGTTRVIDGRSILEPTPADAEADTDPLAATPEAPPETGGTEDGSGDAPGEDKNAGKTEGKASAAGDKPPSTGEDKSTAPKTPGGKAESSTPASATPSGATPSGGSPSGGSPSGGRQPSSQPGAGSQPGAPDPKPSPPSSSPPSPSPDGASPTEPPPTPQPGSSQPGSSQPGSSQPGSSQPSGAAAPDKGSPTSGDPTSGDPALGESP
ncbi:MAG: protein kinase [Myxococcales bacterium]|nr:protein kinase [Myxococcales bacterium]